MHLYCKMNSPTLCTDIRTCFAFFIMREKNGNILFVKAYHMSGRHLCLLEKNICSAPDSCRLYSLGHFFTLKEIEFIGGKKGGIRKSAFLMIRK